MMIRSLVATTLTAAVLLALSACSNSDKDDVANKAGTTAANAALDAASNSGNGNGDETAELPVRKYRFDYNTTIPAGDGTQELRIWVPLPQKDPGVQDVANEKITAPEGYKVTTDKLGNRMIYVAVANPTEDVKVGWSAVITRTEDHGQGKLPNNDRWKQSDSLISVEEAKPHAEQLGLASMEDDQHRADAIYADVLDGMKYSKAGTPWDGQSGWGGGSLHHAMTVCEGNCTDFHARFMGVGRAAGLSVRFTMGVPMKPDARGTYNSYHCWAHWYCNKRKAWIPVDISEADKVVEKDPEKAKWFNGHLCCNRLSLSFGRDITLEPAQAGPALNYFVFPYAEADGQKVALSKDANWGFVYENVD